MNKDRIFTALNHNTLQRVGHISYLQWQVAQWQKLTPLIQPVLPPQGQWQVTCYLHGVLTIAGTNQALISQVRYLQSQYVAQLKTIPALADLERIHVVLYSTPRSQHKTYTRKQTLSNETRQTLRQAASMIKDPELRQALYRLVSHHDEK